MNESSALKVRVSGKALAEAVRQYLELRLAPGCRVVQVWTVPGEDELAFDVEVELLDEPAGMQRHDPMALPEFPRNARRAAPRGAPETSQLETEMDGPEFDDAESLGVSEAEPWAPVVERDGERRVPGVTPDGAVLREAPSLEDEEIEELDAEDPVAARARRRARANRKLLDKRGARRAEG